MEITLTENESKLIGDDHVDDLVGSDGEDLVGLNNHMDDHRL